MKIIQNKALLITTRKHQEIKQLIPKSHIVEQKGGMARMLVHWGLDEYKILKNLGLRKIPHPIRKDYDWPGVFKPMDHQRVTSEFCVANRRGYILNEMGCVDAETEYLSPEGWKRIDQYREGLVAQYELTTGAIEFVQPKEYVKKPCTDMIRFKTTRGVDQLLSPEHRVLYVNTVGEKKVMSAAECLASHETNARGWTGRVITTFTPPKAQGVNLSETLIRLQVALMADGYFPSSTNRVLVRIKKPRKIERLRNLLIQAGVDYSEKEVLPEGFKMFTFCAPLRTKNYANWAWQCNEEQLNIIVDEVGHWDGSFRKKNSISFFTTIKDNADFIQYAFAATGRTASLQVDTPEGYKPCYSVHAREKAALLYVKGVDDNKVKTDTIYRQPSTDGYKYCFMVPSTFLLLRRNGCIFATGNTGKSASAAWAMDYLMQVGIVKRALILCPLSIMESAWVSDLFNTVMHRTVGIAHGTRLVRQKILAGDYEIVIMNHDGVKVVPNEIKQAGFDLIIIDELNYFKSANSERSKALQDIIKPNTIVWGMTGSPAAQCPTDSYGLARVIRPDSVPRFFGRFRDSLLKKVTQFKWVPRPDARDKVFEILQPAVRFTKAECLDLPDRTYIDEFIPLSKQQEQYYKKLKKELVMSAGEDVITAVNAAALLNKLLQISSGAVYTANREVLEFNVKPRTDRLLEIVGETSNKLIVFAPYRHTIDVIQDFLEGQNIKCECIHGGVSAGNRTRIFKKFQEQTDPKVVIIQPEAASHGVTLTRADTVVWWGPIMSTDTYIQANDRAHRKGQRNPVTVVNMFSSHAEQRIFKMLKGNIDIHKSIVDLYKNELDLVK